MNKYIVEEVSQAKARVSIAVLCFLFYVGIFYLEKTNNQAIIFFIVCCLFSIMWLLLLYRYPGNFIWRRRIASLFDISVVSYGIYLLGDWGAIFYFIYLWVIVGNGMRFGSRSLMEVMAMGVVGYSIVLSYSEYWSNNMPTGAGLLMGLIILPCFYMILINRLHTLNEKLNQQLEIATYAATHDGMTGLLNREYFFQQVEEKVAHSERDGEKFAIMFIDLDGFKEVNDSFGHHYGDEILKIAADGMKKAVRKNDVVARLGGDEFAVILSETTSDQIDTFAQRLLSHIEQEISQKSRDVKVTASVGVSVYPDNGVLPDLLLKAADTAMYQSKKSGKNRFTIMQFPA